MPTRWPHKWPSVTICVDTVAGTIELPSHRVVRLHAMLSSFPRSRRTCSKRDLQKLVGELHSMIVAIPGGVGCMSWLQEQLKGAGNRVYLNRRFKDAIDDFRWLAEDIARRPARIAELVPEPPTYVGTSNATRAGMGSSHAHCSSVAAKASAGKVGCLEVRCRGAGH